jgi:hypothetical protein
MTKKSPQSGLQSQWYRGPESNGTPISNQEEQSFDTSSSQAARGAGFGAQAEIKKDNACAFPEPEKDKYFGKQRAQNVHAQPTVHDVITVVNQCPELPEPIRQAILTLLQSNGGKR